MKVYTTYNKEIVLLFTFLFFHFNRLLLFLLKLTKNKKTQKE